MTCFGFENAPQFLLFCICTDLIVLIKYKVQQTEIVTKQQQENDNHLLQMAYFTLINKHFVDLLPHLQCISKCHHSLLYYFRGLTFHWHLNVALARENELDVSLSVSLQEQVQSLSSR